MMMTQPFPAHQGMPQHGFPPGHPMAGQHPNGHPGPGMVQQMHPGVSAPGGPQVSQAGPMMGGMPPGAGTAGPGGPVPNAHALSHLNPAQAHMLQGQPFPQNFANNPQLLQQHQQQQFMRQRMMLQQQQQHQAQQQQHGLPVSLPNGTQGISAAQMAAMQANPGMRPVNMGMHMQQQMPHGQPQNLQQQQFFAIQQAQQQAHQAQQAQQANNGQPGQHTPQRASAQPPNMHEAQSATPQSQHGPPPGSGTPQPSQPAQTPSSQPQPSQGMPQGQATPNPPPQQLPHAQQPNQQGQPGPQPTPQGAQPQPGQPGQPQGPQHPQMMSQDAQLKAQQQHQNALMMQQRMKQAGQSILTLYSYAEVLSNFQSRGEAHDLSYWQTFVERFYSPGGVLRQGVWNNTAGSKQFEIATPALARYYLTQFTSGITQIQMCVEAARERESGNGGHIVESGKTSFVYWFKNECQLFANGTLRAYFDVNNRLEMLDINVLNHNEFIPRSLLLAMEADSQKQSPKVPKNAKRAQQKPTPSLSLPDSMVTANGVPTPVMGFLEVAETISQMQMLFQFSQSNPQLTPPDALRNLVNTLQTQNPNPGFAPGPMNPGMQPMQNVRGPNMNAPSQFASPAMAHLGLPGQQGSPHLTGSAHPSPAQSNLVGPPGMQPPMQPSPAGVNNSPNVGGNKRRRASTVKMESEDGGGVEANGAPQQGSAKVKASPRVPKRQKGAAA